MDQNNSRKTQRKNKGMKVLAPIKLFFNVVVPIIISSLILLVVDSISKPGERLYEFFFSRSIIQYVILYFAGLIIVILIHRTILYFQDRRRFVRMLTNEYADVGPVSLDREIGIVRKCLEENGGESATLCASQIAEERHLKIRQSYEVICFLIGIISALGLFGSVWGLSKALFFAFSNNSAPAIAVQNFVAGLGTALDTTLLAMAFALPLFGAVFLLSHHEESFANQVNKYVQEYFNLDKVALGVREKKQNTQKTLEIEDSTQMACVFQSELRSITGEIIRRMEGACNECVEKILQSYQQKIVQTSNNLIQAYRLKEERVAEKIANGVKDGLVKSTKAFYLMIEKENGRAEKRIVKGLRNLETALRERTPQELILRFPNNGNQEKGK